MGEILNFQLIQFLWMVAPRNFEPNGNVVFLNFYMCAMVKAVTGRPENIIPLFDFHYSIPQFSKFIIILPNGALLFPLS